jgi:mono/diheme cytochrome c family protein
MSRGRRAGGAPPSLAQKLLRGVMRVGRLLAAIVGIVLVAADASAADRIELPLGPNRDLVYAKCRTCHDLQYVVDSAGITRANWVALIEDMGQYGLRIPDEDRKRIIEYLATYLGPNPPKKAAPAGAPPIQTSVDGAAVYARQCSACHQLKGEGLAKTFPPLAGNPDLFVDRLFPVFVVLNGLAGPVIVNGENYQGVMPPFDHLSDAEVAAVVAHIRSAWKNETLKPAGFEDIDVAAVGEARKRRMSSTEVHAYRAARQ